MLTLEGRATPHPRPVPLAARYDSAPLMIYWELTRACGLACRHCRASAVAGRDPQELTTEQGFRLLEALVRFGQPPPHLVFTGGDPLMRPDVYELAAHAIELGLPAAITPSGTPLLTREALERLAGTGIRTVALSLDGSSPERHDRIRMVPGSFERTVAAARWARQLGLSLQINSLVCAETDDDLPALYDLAARLDADRWSAFFLVAVGRGEVLGQVTPERCEQLLEWFYELAARAPRPAIKTTEAHHFRRIALQRHRQRAAAGGSALGGPSPDAAAAMRRGFGIRDGAGIMFISHTGDVYPSGFLPLAVGNVKGDDPVRLYREAHLFTQLRDPSQLKGKCGACEFRTVCGGSRSRAWAATGDPLEADPLCVYQPASRARLRATLGQASASA